MLDKLIEILHAIWGSLLPFVVFAPYQAGVLIRLGKFERELGPGFHWVIPFADRLVYENTVPRTSRVHSLATTTKDGKTVGLEAVITWRIKDLQKSLLEVNDLKDAIEDSCAGIIGTELSNALWEDILQGRMVEQLTAACRKNGWRWGVEIMRVQLTGVAPVKNIRLLLPSHSGADTLAAI